MQVSVF